MAAGVGQLSSLKLFQMAQYRDIVFPSMDEISHSSDLRYLDNVHESPYVLLQDESIDMVAVIPDDLKDPPLLYHDFLNHFLDTVIDGVLFKPLEKWCSTVLIKSSADLAECFMKFILRLEAFVYKYSTDICALYTECKDVEDAMKMIGQRLLCHSSIDKFQHVLKRVLKFGFSLYREYYLEPDCPVKINVVWEDFFEELSQRLEVLVSKLDLKDFVVEGMSQAYKEMAHVCITRHFTDLTDPDMYFNAISEHTILTHYVGSQHVVFETLKQYGLIYFSKAYIHFMIDNSYDLVITKYPGTRENMMQFLRTMKALNWYSRDKFLKKLIGEIRSKLLKTGVPTKQILISYANVAECLALFDESCGMMHKACQVIKEYVISRQDTIRTIIRYVTAERPGVYEQGNGTVNLSKMDSTKCNDEYLLAIEESNSNLFDFWVPDNGDAEPTNTNLARQSADVFSMLVMIYGTKDMFVKEYRTFLADRLIINGYRHNFEDEVSYLNMMKQRFRDGELTQCEVMLDDMKCSEVFCSTFKDVLDLRVISAEYWPEITDIPVPVLDWLIPIQDHFVEAFKVHKYGTRKLHWFSTYGAAVELNLTMGSIEVKVEVSMLHFRFIQCFTEKEVWTTQEIEAALQMPRLLVQKLSDWWSDRGCINRDGHELTLCEDESCWLKFVKEAEDKKTRLMVIPDEEATEDSTDEVEDEDAELVNSMEEFWNYIFSNIKMTAKKNHQGNPITADRLLSMFRLFGSPGKPLYQLKHVQSFMARKVRAGFVYIENGVYKSSIS